MYCLKNTINNRLTLVWHDRAAPFCYYPGCGVATVEAALDILSFLHVVNFFKKNKETVRLKGDGSEVSLVNIKKKKAKEKKIAYNTGHFLRVTHPS